jgi:hypothetical protein
MKSETFCRKAALRKGKPLADMISHKVYELLRAIFFNVTYLQ